MVKGAKNPFVDKRNCTIYRIVHNQQGDVAEGAAPVGGTLQLVHGQKDYFPEETAKLEAAYREELAARAKQQAGFVPGEDGWEEEEYEEYEEGEEGEEEWDEDGWDEEEGTMRKDRSEMTQLERDIDELGLPEDGYDYSMHLRNPGQGLFLKAMVSSQMADVIERREAMKFKHMTKAEREVFELLENDNDGIPDSDNEPEGEEEDDDDDEVPALEDEEKADYGAAAADQKKEKKKKGTIKAPHTGNKILIEGDLPDDILSYLDGNGADNDSQYEAYMANWQPPENRLIDERFDVMMDRYGDDAIGELDDEHPGLKPAGGEEANYYALLDQYIAMGKAPVSQPEFMEGKRQMIETEEYFDMIQEDEEEEKKLIDATRRLIITQEKEGEIFHGDYEEVEVEEREQWDAESILSTYSNIYNRPSIIHDGKDRRIKLHPVTGVPMIGGAKQAEMDSVGEGAEDDEEDDREPIMIAKRERGETPEEKKARKELSKQVKAAALEKKKAKAITAGMAKGRPVVGGADPRTRPGLSVTRYVA